MPFKKPVFKRKRANDLSVSKKKNRKKLHSCASALHKQCAEIVETVLRADGSKGKGVNLKSLTLAPEIQSKKATHAVVCETLRCKTNKAEVFNICRSACYQGDRRKEWRVRGPLESEKMQTVKVRLMFWQGLTLGSLYVLMYDMLFGQVIFSVWFLFGKLLIGIDRRREG